MDAADPQEKPRKSNHMVQRQEQRNIDDEGVEVALQGECVPTEKDGLQRYNGENGVVVIRAQNNILVTTYEDFSIGLAVITPPELATAVCTMSNEHISREDKAAFPRSKFAGCVGSGVIGLMALDVSDESRDNGNARQLIPSEFHALTVSKNIDDWSSDDCGYNSDWQRLYKPDHMLYDHLPDARLLSGVELPNPAKGYPNLDILGLLAKTNGTSNVDEVLDRLQQRAVVEAGVAVHRQFLQDRLFVPCGSSEHPRHLGLPVCYVTAVIPADAQVVEIMVDDDWALRLESYYSRVSERVATNVRFAAIVPADFDLATLHEPAIRDLLAPMSKQLVCILPCQDCENGKHFTWTMDEEQYFRKRRWQQPRRCHMHREAKKNARGDFRASDSVMLNCEICQQPFEWFLNSYAQRPPQHPLCPDHRPIHRRFTSGNKSFATRSRAPEGSWR